jgi:hypothetical protein
VKRFQDADPIVGFCGSTVGAAQTDFRGDIACRVPQRHAPSPQRKEDLVASCGDSAVNTAFSLSIGSARSLVFQISSYEFRPPNLIANF